MKKLRRNLTIGLLVLSSMFLLVGCNKDTTCEECSINSSKEVENMETTEENTEENTEKNTEKKDETNKTDEKETKEDEKSEDEKVSVLEGEVISVLETDIKVKPLNREIEKGAEDDYYIIVKADDKEIVDELELKEGDVIRAYAPIGRPQTMEFPESFRTNAIIKVTEDMPNVKTDDFDDELISSDGMLKLNIEDEEMAKDFRGKTLLVIYDISTKSIPAQTTPIEVIVLQ